MYLEEQLADPLRAVAPVALVREPHDDLVIRVDERTGFMRMDDG